MNTGDQIVPDLNNNSVFCGKCNRKFNISSVDVGTQTEIMPVTNDGYCKNSTYWCQMGCELRHIADNLREQSLSAGPDRNQNYSKLLVSNAARRRSLPDGSIFFHPI